MVFIWLSIYFLAISVAVALISLPAHRTHIAELARALTKRTPTLASSKLPYGQGSRPTRPSFAGNVTVLQKNPLLLAAAFVLVAAPPAVVSVIRGPAIFTFDDVAQSQDRQIEALLRGEHLIPPPALPPEAFTTREVELIRPDIAGANRSWEQLSPEFTRRLLTVFKVMREQHGYEMTLIEGYRSPERQAALALQGSQVTRASANMSYHQYGLAGDCAFVRDGRVVISERDPWAMHGYELYGALAETYGLTWGGRWSFRDLGHVELPRSGVLGSPRT
ncbi:MAG TPA: M15 family metallopeptidase [Aromatoleum sp.]|uniref:M15 family metallopeptidase n=1 Tax=Aromatoleum sp. TaxID=2307007 RepID=UPI002B4689C5|nr:M15 family metallopeptidase [Aromatoleum sp.]HJV27448.1 M15 family metallopeptidase [Aromatoleum sp.]